MLSASTISSSSSSAGAFTSNSGFSTPSSQFSNDPRKTSGNPLTELIETEQSYIETLNMIDSQIAPIWMKQMNSAAPDFSELLIYIHDILKVNKRFCMKLNRIASNPQAISELGDTLMQWVNELEIPYANYSRSYVPNLNQRFDILPSIQPLLQKLSASASYEINLESLFNAPIQQLKYYKGLYNRLLEGTDPGRDDHRLLVSANKKIDMVMAMAKKSSLNTPANKYNGYTATPSLPHIQTNFQPSVSNFNSDLTTFEHQVDCSRTIDLFGKGQIDYQLRIATPGARLVTSESFSLFDGNGSSIKAHLTLTTEFLVVCRELGPSRFSLMYPAISIRDVTVQAESLDRETVGEYIIRFLIQNRKSIVASTESKNIRNMWVGVDQNPSSTSLLTPRPLNVTVHKILTSLPPVPNSDDQHKNNGYSASPSKSKGKGVRNTDIFTYYSESGEISPLESSDEEDSVDDYKNKNVLSSQQGKSRDTIMDIYDNHMFNNTDDDLDQSQFPLPPSLPPKMHEDLANLAPKSVKMVHTLPNVAQAQGIVYPEDERIPTELNKDSLNVKNKPPPNMHSTAGNEPVKGSSHVQMTYIEAPTAQMATMSISPPIPKENELNNSVQASPDRFNGNGMKNNDSKPASPRAVEVQRAVIPEVMQAVTQKTDEYLSGNNKPVPEFSERPNVAQPPTFARGSSRPSEVGQGNYNNVSAQQNYQQRTVRPQMMQNGYPGHPRSPVMNNQQNYNQSKPLPNQQQRPGMTSNNSHHGYNRPMPPNSPQQQFRPSTAHPTPVNSINNNGFTSSPTIPSSLTGPARGASHGSQPSPPNSPSPYGSGSDIRQVLYTNSQCNVFRWSNNSWYAVEGQCLLQIRLMHSGRRCVAVQLQNTGQLYLNAWILTSTVIRQPSPTDISISMFMGDKKENYLVHFAHPNDASVFSSILQKSQQEASTFAAPVPIHLDDKPEPEEEEPINNVNVPQTLKPVMQCKAKLFIQNETSSWSSLGSVQMRISQQSPSMRMMIQMENNKTKLVSAIVKSGNVEKINSKRISFLLQDAASKTSMVYLVHIRDEQTGNKIYDYLRNKNSENGW